MERLNGPTVKSWLHSLPGPPSGAGDQRPSPAALAVASQMGAAVALVHSKAGIVHGDLTTSNMVVLPAGPGSPANDEHEVALLDFGLAQTTRKDEDRAVDLYVLERALISTHVNAAPLNEAVLHAYFAAMPAAESASVKARLDTVRHRGRKKIVFG